MPSLSVKYRPNDFSEIVGQEVITKILTQQL
uniref:DNA polymerase III, subunit gamma and tau n=1 Tax=Siphoviridae sp. ctiOl67 TaxID=2825622 RepID=A0A8S5QI26_9CAUD|nr:MAG TPA: DNA polymerase III, subunit gamma and tau [Siphoviridae sp. ctiOl67]